QQDQGQSRAESARRHQSPRVSRSFFSLGGAKHPPGSRPRSFRSARLFPGPLPIIRNDFGLGPVPLMETSVEAPEAELIARAQGGDLFAFEELVRRYGRRVYGVA